MAETQRCQRRTVVVGRPIARRRSFAVTAMVFAVLTMTSCSETSGEEPTAVDYIGALEAICADTAAQLDALPDPPAAITVTEFATQASSILTGEAEQIRGLDAPDDLDDDHRALITNDESQAEAWTEVADAASQGAGGFSEITTTIASLNLGRNDLVTEMGAPGCVRAPG